MFGTRWPLRPASGFTSAIAAQQIDILGHGISCSLGGEAGLHSAPGPGAPNLLPRGHRRPTRSATGRSLRAGWFDRAEPLFRSALARHGERPDILHFLAVCLSQRGALSDAEAMWRKALAKDPNEPMLSYNLGLVARRQGRLDEAARRFRDTVRRSPAHVEARLALASVYMDIGRFAAAERELIEFVTNLDQAIQQGGEGLKPLQARARNMLGYALYRLGHHSSAIEVLDMALVDAGEDAARRGQILGDRALALGAIGHHDEAIAEAGRALELAPDSAGLNHRWVSCSSPGGLRRRIGQSAGARVDRVCRGPRSVGARRHRQRRRHRPPHRALRRAPLDARLTQLSLPISGRGEFASVGPSGACT